MRIVFLDHIAVWSGGEIALHRLLAGLRDAKTDVEPLLVLGEDGPLAERVAELGVEVRVLPMAGRTRSLSRAESARLPLRAVWDTLHYVWRLRGILRQERPDLVHTNSLKSGIYGSLAARLAGVPVVWHVRDRIAEDYLGRPLTLLVRPLLALLPSAILVNSEATRQTIGRALARVPNAVLDDPYRPDEVASPRPRPHAEPVVALVGRMAPWKGQHLFLDALERLPTGLRARGLLLGSALFGEEEYAAGVEQRVDSTENTRISSFTGDVSEALADVDVVVNASVIPEPFGQVVVEAIANGVPVVVPDEGGPAEIVQHGTSGLVYRAGDPDSLAQRLAELLGDTDLYARLSAGGLERARAYDPEQVAASYRVFVTRVPGRASPSS